MCKCPQLLTYCGGDVSCEDFLSLLDWELRPELEVQVGELDVVGIVEACVVDEAVDGVEGHAGAAFVPMVLQLHAVSPQNANHPLNFCSHVRRRRQQDYVEILSQIF